MNLFVGQSQKLARVKVTTMDADLNSVVIELNWTGRQLFDTVCRIIGLREIWYFGLRYMNKKELPCWLQMDKKISLQEVPKQNDGAMHFLFLVKFYPETVEEELIQDITRHLFFLQIKQCILSMDLYCQPEAAVLLASYAVQAMHGDCNEGIELNLAKLLPQSVIDQYDMSIDMWEERIRKWWANNSGLSIEDAEMEYLRVAQDLDMYGIQYYSIYNQKDTDLLLGVSAQGIGIYEISNRLSPRPFFPWTEIKNIAFHNKLFTICVTDSSKIKFRAQDCSINASILDLCIGTHNLYLRRRQPDLLEIQQMKVQSREQRQKKIVEQNRWLRERELRQQAEAERDRYKTEITILTEQLATMQNMVKSTEESHKLIAEKARVSEQEALELSKRASEAEAEVQRVKLSQFQAEESKMVLERKVRDAELTAQRLLQDSEKRSRNGNFNGNRDDTKNVYRSQQVLYRTNNYDSNQINQQQNRQSYRYESDGNEQSANILRHHSYGELHNFEPSTTSGSTTGNKSINGVIEETISGCVNSSLTPSAQNVEKENDTDAILSAVAATLGDDCFKNEIQSLYAEIEKSRKEYYEKNRNLKERLMDFRTEIEILKRENRLTDHDRIYTSNLQSGIDKYSTLRKSGAGSSKSRVKVFDGL